MQTCKQFYINGEWLQPSEDQLCDVSNPATERSCGTITMGTVADVDRAVIAARHAFEFYSKTSKSERLELLQQILTVFTNRSDDFADLVRQEIGAPISLAKEVHVGGGIANLAAVIEAYKNYHHHQRQGSTLITHEAIGVCGLIMPWNFPLGITLSAVAPALAVGCTVVLKPSEIAPLSSHLIAEVMHEAGVPAGVFNLVDGDGPTVGHAIASHPGIDKVSFTGSTVSGIAVAKAAADTVKRVSQELGGKSANIIFDDVDLDTVIPASVTSCFLNSGQNCIAPSRLLVPRTMLQRCTELAKTTAESVVIGDPQLPETELGPVISQTQYQRIQTLIKQGIEEDAELVCGGLGKPEGLETGYFVKPTIFSSVNNDMSIAQQEIFGPVLVIIAYDDEAEAIRLANDTAYGLAAYIQCSDPETAKRAAEQMQAGLVFVNGGPLDLTAPLGGYKQSGNGLGWGVYGLEEFMESKSITGLPI